MSNAKQSKNRLSSGLLRRLAVITAALTLVLGFPATASANLSSGSSVTLVQQGTIYYPGNGGVFFPNTTLGTINTADTVAASALTTYGVPTTTQPFVLTTAMKNNMPGGSTTWDNFKFNVGSTYQIYSLSNPASNYSLVGAGGNYSAAKLDYAITWSEAKLNIGGTERWVVFNWFNLIIIETPVPAVPMVPTNKPTVTISSTSIMCTMGSYSATPTSSIFSLYVDGIHVATDFSATGEYLPDWIVPWATPSTITRTATLTSATWAMRDSYKGKAITCSTIAYSKNAIGTTLSEIQRTV